MSLQVRRQKLSRFLTGANVSRAALPKFGRGIGFVADPTSDEGGAFKAGCETISSRDLSRPRAGSMLDLLDLCARSSGRRL